ncbi:MAG: peptidoglycan editing factor PgeF [Ignavibacteria bacterium]|nr:peptidoglycan editing factor PgeF [Ignavibacteria bacterium]
MILTSPLFASVRTVRFGISTRQGGVSPEPYGMNLSFLVGDEVPHVEENRRRFFGSLGIDPASLAIPDQIHGDRVVYAHEPGRYPECDGVVSDRAGVHCCVSVADCVPVFLVDPVRQAVAVVHAGWRGTVAGIARRGVRMMQDTFGSHPEDLLAHIGPGADVCCYEVGAEVAARFARDMVLGRGKKWFANLKKANKRQLLDAGLTEKCIEVSPLCTISDTSLHSYRRDGKRSGRMMGVIGLKGEV